MVETKLRVTPAMAAGVIDRLWAMSDTVAQWGEVELPENVDAIRSAPLRRLRGVASTVWVWNFSFTRRTNQEQTFAGNG